MYSKKINKLHATTPLWKTDPHIRVLWFTLLMNRDEKGFIDATIDDLKQFAELSQTHFDHAFLFLIGKSEKSDRAYITEAKNGFKLNCLDQREKEQIDSMPLWKERTEKGFNEYIRITQKAFKEIMIDYNFLLELKEFYPHTNISESIRKAFTLYWGTEKAWIKRRRKRANTFNWRETIANTIRFHLVRISNNSTDYELDYLQKKVKEQREKNHAKIS